MYRQTLLLSALLLLVLSACEPTLQDPVEVDGGLLAGVQLADSPVRVYKGIPFAAPPVGDLRWKEPQPAATWEGILQADTFSEGCVQNLDRSRPPHTEEFMHLGSVSEDCLYLNVWTAAEKPGENLPVMVYLYGGGLREGSTAVAVYDGEALARKGVLLVSINYRLGPIGYMAHPELSEESPNGASGNYGFLDQIAALKWINNNIEAFGGDPGNVTIFGQSAGSSSVTALMRSPLAKGLFARGIRQSGAERRAPLATSYGTPLAEAEQWGITVQEGLGVASLAELREVPAERFVVPPGFGRMGAVVDGWFLTDGLLEVEQTPVMAGFVANDSFSQPGASEVTDEPYSEQARMLYGENADAYLALYPAAEGADIEALKMEAGRDRARVGMSLWAADQSKVSEAVYTYYFNRAIPWPEYPDFGAFHTGEVPYVFNTIHVLDRPWEDVDRTVADQMSSYWTNFAKTGNPGGEGLADFSAVSGEDVTMGLGAKMGMMPTANSADKVAFWKKMWLEAAG